ncbi:MAG TPA: TetR/AcrR family transcriptional regulator [Anaerolineales bacterium]
MEALPVNLYTVKIIDENLDVVKYFIYDVDMPKKQYHHGDLKNALVQAGMEILATEGVGALSLRKVAGKAGVSHSAPYAHFTDKQGLIAAISTESFRQLYARVIAAAEAHPSDPAAQLVEAAWAYVQFALENPAYFKVMFSGVLEKEQDYPDFVNISHQNFQLLVNLVRDCQQVGLLRSGAEDVIALSAWSLVHGFVALLLERQISRTILERYLLKELLCQTLNQVTLIDLSCAAK